MSATLSWSVFRLAKLQKEVDSMAVLMSEAAEDDDAEIVVEEVEVTDSEEEDEEKVAEWNSFP